MAKKPTLKPTAPRRTRPAEGGSYVRTSDAELRQVEATRPAGEAPPAEQPPAEPASPEGA